VDQFARFVNDDGAAISPRPLSLLDVTVVTVEVVTALVSVVAGGFRAMTYLLAAHANHKAELRATAESVRRDLESLTTDGGSYG
jgi:uncharacterized membrane protein